MESESCEPESNCPITLFKIIPWPTHLLGPQIPQTFSSFKDVIPELSQSSAPVFEIAQTRDGIVSASNLPEDPAYLASKILTILERRALIKKMRRQLASVSTPAPQVCPYCEKSFGNLSHWRRHVNMHTGEVKYPCSLCKKIFFDKSTLLRHKKIHSGEKPWRCKMCNKCFHTLPSLRRHITVHNPAGRPFECHICHKRFPDKSSHKKHIFTHTGLRPHLCNVCSKTFVHLGDLNCHMKIHADKKEFICPHCKKEFAKCGNYQRHLKIHEGKMAYQCRLCHIGYNFRSSLTRHMLKHQQEKLRTTLIICLFCNAKFLNRSALKRHLLLHFGETVNEKCKVGVQNSNPISKNCDSRNDINKRPLTYKEISFVRRNLKRCRVVQLYKSHKSGHKNLYTGSEEVMPNSKKTGQTRDSENVLINSGRELLPLQDLDENIKARSDVEGHVDQVSETDTSKCGSVSTVQKKRRGRPRKLLPNPVSINLLGVKQVGAEEHKCDGNSFGKHKRGRPRKDVKSPAKENIAANEFFCKLLEAEQKQKLDRPKRRVSKLSDRLPQIHDNNNHEIILTQKRKRGRPRKQMNVCSDGANCVIEPRNLKSGSATSINELPVKHKRKRGRPRKPLNTVTDKESLDKCQSLSKEIVTDRVLEIVAEENHEVCEDVQDRNASENIMPDEQSMQSMHNAKKEVSGNLKVAVFKTTDVCSENKQYCGLYADVCEPTPLIENVHTSKYDENLDKLCLSRRKQTRPKRMLLHTADDNECLQKSCVELGDSDDDVEETEMLSGENGVELERNDSVCKKKRGRLKEQMLNSASIHVQEHVGEYTNQSTENCTNSVDLSFTVFSDTETVNGKSSSIALTSEDNLTVDLDDEKKLMKLKDEGKIPVYLICDNDVIEGYSMHGSTKNFHVEENEFEEHFYQEKSHFVCDTQARNISIAQKKISFDGLPGSPGTEHFITNTSKIMSVKNMCKKTIPEQLQKCYTCDCSTVVTVMEGCKSREAQQLGLSAVALSDTADTVTRQSVKEVLLNDWQSDDSQSSETLEVIWEHIKQGFL